MSIFSLLVRPGYTLPIAVSVTAVLFPHAPENADKPKQPRSIQVAESSEKYNTRRVRKHYETYPNALAKDQFLFAIILLQPEEKEQWNENHDPPFLSSLPRTGRVGSGTVRLPLAQLTLGGTSARSSEHECTVPAKRYKIFSETPALASSGEVTKAQVETEFSLSSSAAL